MTEQARSLDYSLQTRLLLAITILLGIFLSLTGFVLDSAFRNSLETRVSEQLQVQIYVLLAAVEEESGDFYFVEDLREPRLTQPNSGLYGFITDTAGSLLLRTPSALELEFDDFRFQRDTLNRGQTDFGRINNSAGQEFFVTRYGVIWESEQNYTFTIIESTSTYAAEVNDFRASLWSWLGGLAILLLILQLLLLRWGLEPLRRLARDLKRIESGEAEALDTTYPRELKAVTENLNLLIKSERKQQSRYRTTLGDLAHSLKTPLAVIRGQLSRLGQPAENQPGEEESPFALIEEQVQRMNQIVSYQLQRAVKTNEANVLARRVNIQPLVKKVLAAMAKVYADKEMQVVCNIDSGAYFLGDERDLMEIMGNLLDNAFKYGNSRVWVNGHAQQGGAASFELTIEDDGPGIPVEHREFVLQRGARVDSLARGQGIGLAVVTDIVSSYGGQITIVAGNADGACIRLLLSNVQLHNLSLP